MINIQSVRERYAFMDDWELLATAKEPADLSQDAFILLKREMRKRGLNLELIQEAEEHRVQLEKDRVRNNVISEWNQLRNRGWRLLVQQTTDRIPPTEIQQNLYTLGLHQDDVSDMIIHARSIAASFMKRLARQMKLGGLSLMAGIFILYLLVSKGTSVSGWNFYYLAGILIIYGGARFFTAEADYQAHRLFLQVLDEDQLTT